jgi:geranylgeranyl reductase family protein
MYQTIVVGAGPAGATAAKHLAEHGIQVLLLDKASFPRDKPCGGGIPHRVLQEFPYITTNNLIESSSYGGHLHSSRLDYHITLEQDKPLIAMVLRKTFDHGLVQLAQKAGAEFQPETKVTNITITHTKAIVTLEDHSTLETELLIGADGIHSIVAKKTGLRTTPLPHGLCAYHECAIPKKLLDTYFNKTRIGHIFLSFHNLPGYGWVFPKKNHLNIGIEHIIRTTAYPSNKNITTYFQDFLTILKEHHHIPDIVVCKKPQGGIFPTKTLPQTYHNRVLICGDAAGMVNPATGEGIGYALLSGKYAAKTAHYALTIHNTRKQTLRSYQKLWKTRFGKDLRFFTRAQKLLGKNTDRFVKTVSQDPQLSQMTIEGLFGNVDIHRNRKKIMRRYLYCTARNVFKRNH